MKSDPSIADRVQRLRKHLNLSQEQLASKLDVSFATINRWESGKSTPQKAQLVALDRLWTDASLDETESSSNGTGTRRRRGVQHSTVLGNKSMEQMLWDAACSIRGEKDAPKFKDYILPLLFA